MSEVAVIGIGPIDIQRTEYLSRKVMGEFTSYMAILKEILDKRPENSSDPNNPLNPTADDYNLLILTLKGLSDLARNGRMEDGKNSSPYLQLLNNYMEAKLQGNTQQADEYLNQMSEYPGTPTSGEPNAAGNYLSRLNGDMVQSLNDVMKTLKLVGISPNSSLQINDQAKVQALQTWQAYAGFGVEEILRRAVTLSADAEQFIAQNIVDNQGRPLLVQRFPTHSLQSMLEVEYIKVSNSILSSNLERLYNALSLTQTVIQTLQGLQIISAQINIDPRNPPFTLPNTNNLDDYEDRYRDAAKAYFSQLNPSARPNQTAARDLFASKMALSAHIAQLELANPNATRNTAGSLAQSLFVVLKDISNEFSKVNFSGNIFQLYQTNPANFEDVFQSAVVSWIIDGQNIKIDSDLASTGALDIQNHLEQATTVASNLNDTQRDDVRRYMFIFEEFYKSACAMLELISRMIEKINKGAVLE